MPPEGAGKHPVTGIPGFHRDLPHRHGGLAQDGHGPFHVGAQDFLVERMAHRAFKTAFHGAPGKADDRQQFLDADRAVGVFPNLRPQRRDRGVLRTLAVG